jgi:hypothetical protein
VTLPNSISSAPGRVTIEYSSLDELRDQLQLLAKAVDMQREIVKTHTERSSRSGERSEI